MNQNNQTLDQYLGKYQELYNTFHFAEITKWDSKARTFQVKIEGLDILVDSKNDVKFDKLKMVTLYDVIGKANPIGSRVGVYIVKRTDNDGLDVRCFLKPNVIYLLTL